MSLELEQAVPAALRNRPAYRRRSRSRSRRSARIRRAGHRRRTRRAVRSFRRMRTAVPCTPRSIFPRQTADVPTPVPRIIMTAFCSPLAHPKLSSPKSAARASLMTRHGSDSLSCAHAKISTFSTPACLSLQLRTRPHDC